MKFPGQCFSYTSRNKTGDVAAKSRDFFYDARAKVRGNVQRIGGRRYRMLGPRLADFHWNATVQKVSGPILRHIKQSPWQQRFLHGSDRFLLKRSEFENVLARIFI